MDGEIGLSSLPGPTGPAGAVNGTGVAKDVAFWTNATDLGASADLQWDDVAKVLAATSVLLPGIVNPTPPAAGNALLHALTTQGFTRFEQDNEAPTNITLGRDTVFIVKNGLGVTLTKGSVVYVTSHDGAVPVVGLAKADSTTTMPAIGAILDDIGAGAFGQCMRGGIFAGVDTSIFTDGTTLYLSEANAGAGTITPPAAPNFVQTLGVVLSADAVTGSILVTVAPAILPGTGAIVANGPGQVIIAGATTAGTGVNTIAGNDVCGSFTMAGVTDATVNFSATLPAVPSVCVTCDSTGNHRKGVTAVSTASFTVSFDNPFTGTVYYHALIPG